MPIYLPPIICFLFLFAWSRLPDGKPVQDSKLVPTPDESEEVMIPVSLGERIPEIPGYKPDRIVVDHVAHPPRVVIYKPA